jgi:glycosyltransferase involved in cell wall biosynthesis
MRERSPAAWTVAFDARGAQDPRGVGRYIRSLLGALRETAGERLVEETHRPRRGAIYHAPWMEGAAVRCPIPQVVTLHDLVPLKRRTDYLRTGRRFGLRYLAVQRADRVIVPTDAVGADAQDHLRIDPARIVTIPEAADATMRPRSPAEVAAARERHGLPGEYLVWVGGLEHPDPRRRVASLLDQPHELPIVLVGPAREWAHGLADRGGVHVTGLVDDDDLAAIYSGARALVYPSDDEGFGLPAVEALACGTPVVASDVPALREVLHGRADLVAADDLPELLRRAVAATRPAPAPPAWSWEDAARVTWDVYERAVAGA